MDPRFPYLLIVLGILYMIAGALGCSTFNDGMVTCGGPTITKGMKDKEKCEHGSPDPRCTETTYEVECSAARW